MNQENKNNRAVKKSRFVWVVLSMSLGIFLLTMAFPTNSVFMSDVPAAKKLFTIMEASATPDLLRPDGIGYFMRSATKALLSMMMYERGGSVEEVTKLIKAGANVNATSDFGRTPLSFAAENCSNPEILRVLIENGANVNAAHKYVYGTYEWPGYVLSGEMGTPLTLAAKYNSNPEILRLLIENGADVVKSIEGERALDYAEGNKALKGTDAYNLLREETVRILKNPTEILLALSKSATTEEVKQFIQEGADVNAVKDVGYKYRTLLMSVAEYNPNPEILRLLIENGAKVNAVDRYGQTSLMLAAMYRSNPEFLMVLLENGADVNGGDEYGWTPLMLAAGYNSNANVLRLLIENGADVSIRNKWGRRALDCLSENKKLSGTDAYSLLQEKTLSATSPVSKPAPTPTPRSTESRKEATENLPYVVRWASVEEVTRLIRNGADVNAVDKRGRTPLILAAWYNSKPEVLRVLLENGADVNAVDKYGTTPLMLAAWSNSNPEALRVLIENGADVNAGDEDGVVPLMHAVISNSNPDVLRILLENGASVNSIDKDGMTPLIWAAKRNSNPDVLRVLIENGASVNSIDKDGMTPLMWAAERNSNPDVLRVLLENGASVNSIDKDGMTPLMWAAKRNSNPDVLRVLIENGADVDFEDKYGRTARFYARRNGKLKGTDAYNHMREKALYETK